ncbi:MAG: phosphatidylserine decarboxylase [Gemmatimonadales bacterium]
MRVAPEGWPWIALAWSIELLLIAWWWPAAIGGLLVACWVIAFFRDPIREGPRGEQFIIAPADGRVVSVISIDEPKMLGGAAKRVSIFMNVFNVHVNRYPVSGLIIFRQYQRGVFGHAGREKAAVENEHSDVGIESARGKLLTRQIAGSIARRSVTDDGLGTAVTQGTRMGLIRFGSRVDVFLPATATILVKEGDVTLGGVTVIAEWT